MARTPFFAASCLLVAPAAAQGRADAPPMGFGPEGGAAQIALEKAFDERVDVQNIDDWTKFMSSRPHHAGSAFGDEVAKFMAEKFRSWGYETKIETYQVLFPTPRVRIVEMKAPFAYEASLAEPEIPGDPASAPNDERLPTYNSFSADGDVTAEVVFVNQGVPKDYEDLERLGIDVEGKLVLARYGGSWRGIKPKVAQEKGALGVLLYTDPEDDGYFRGDAYPEGGYRPNGAVQMGSVLDLPLRPGDPLTPYRGATNDAKRIPRAEADNLLKIPVLPISASDAMPILAALGGPVAPARWRGAMPLTYHVGPGPAVVRLKLEFDWDLVPAQNVVATLKGSTYPDEWVMRGNHHDAWANGARDPVSGMAALMEEARIVGELAREGRGPKRTVVYAGWDAEEPALLGSVEWVEDHLAELQAKLVAYINTDSNGRGFLNAGGSHTLQAMFAEIAEAVDDPAQNASVAERVRARARLHGPDALRKAYESGETFRLSPLGSGSDYSAFLQHAGIASLNLGFGGEDEYGVYHSVYDSYAHYVAHIDPGFAYGGALAKTTGRATLRLANAETLPFEFSTLTEAIKRYADEVKALTDDMRDETERHNALVADGVFDTAADPRERLVAPEAKRPVPYFNFAPMLNALAAAEAAADAFEAARSEGETSGEARARLNAMMREAERKLTRAEGLPRRPWFKHHIYAPGFYTGYGVKTLPGVREAIEEREFDAVAREVEDVAAVFRALAAHLDAMRAVVEAG
ncbi:MAG: transferrin receptor-like dimerization domain-containing protein [Parvularculaceae bacterium]